MRPGDLLAERFEIQRSAAAGGMGAVYRALDRRTGAPVAVKILHSQAEHDAVRFQREAEALSALRGPAIVRYVAHGVTAAGAPWLAMEWLEGETLGQRLRAGWLALDEALTVAARGALALGAAHRLGIVHRDLKPGNLMLVDGAIARTTLIDFGIAHIPRSAELTQTGAMIGTPGYMAPEQARGQREIDARADVFALGCVLFRCLAGRAAFEGDDALGVLIKVVLEDPPRLRQLRPEVPEALEDLVARMLAKLPDQRPRDADAVAAEIAAIRAPTPARDHAAAPKAASAELTSAEQKVMCLILARAPQADAAATLVLEESNARRRAARQVAERCRGQLDQLVDQSFLVTLSGTGTANDLAAQAARCALALAALLTDLPVAVVSGRSVVSGHLPIGELIERATALVGPGRAAGEVVIDAVTAGLLGGRFEVDDDPAGHLLRRERGALEAVRTVLGRPTTFVGRERDLSLLEATFARCAEESVPGAMLVTAPAGMGKSRLCYELIGALQRRAAPVEIWVARGDPMSAGSAFGLVGEALRHAAGVQMGEPLEARRTKLRARVARRLSEADAPRITAFLGELAGVPFPDEHGVELRAARRDTMLMGDQIRRAWEDFLAAETQAQPVLLVLEDLHWGDLPSVRLVDDALRALGERPFLALATGRPELRQLFPDLWGERNLFELRLGGLSRKAAERLVRQILGPTVAEAQVERMVRYADGNAFYLEELIRAAASGSDAALPETVLAMVETRLEGFAPELRHVLRAASVFGQTFWSGGLLALLGGAMTPSALREALALLETHEVIARESAARFPGEQAYVFRQAPFREAAYAMLTAADRTLGHRLAGRWLEQRGERDAVLLAEHLERGELRAQAARWYRRAAEEALEGNDIEAAVSRARKGLAAISTAAGRDPASQSTIDELRLRRSAPRASPDRAPELTEPGPLHLVLAEAHRWRGKLAEAELAALEAVASLPAGSALWFRAASEAVLSSGRLGHADRAVGVAELVRARAPGDAEAAEAKIVALCRASAEVLNTGRTELAETFLHTVNALLAEHAVENPVVHARADDAHARRALAQNLLGESLQRKLRALRGYERAGDRRMVCALQVSVGYAQTQLGAYAEAERTLAFALATAEQLRLTGLAPSARENLGQAIAGLGRREEAMTMIREAIAAFQAQGSKRMEVGGHIYLALMLAAQGELQGAHEEARAALALAASAPMRAYALAVQAQVLLFQKRSAEALTVSRQAMDLLGSLGTLEAGEALIRLVYAEALWTERDPATASAILEARDRLLDRAAKLDDDTLRRSFLEQVPENARTLWLAETWLRAP